MFLGNLFVYILFQGKVHIDAETRNTVFGVLIGLGVVGICFLLSLGRVETPESPTEIVGENEKVAVVQQPEGPLSALYGAFKLFCTKEMLLLSITFIYTGKIYTY